MHEQKTKRRGWFSADYTAKRCVLNIIIPLHGAGALHDHIPVSAKLYSAMRSCGTMPSESGVLLPL